MAEPQTQQPNPPAASIPNPPPPAGNQPPPAKPEVKPEAVKKEPKGSIYEAIGEVEPGAEGSHAWPENWRDQMIEGLDPKAANVMARFQSPADLAKAFIAAQQKIRSGEYKRAMPKSDNPDDLKAWREEQGIPASPDEYEIPTIAGVDLAALDEPTKENLGVMKTAFHEAGISKEAGGTVAKALVTIAERQMQVQAEADANHYDANEDALRAEWGGEFKHNLAVNWKLLTDRFGDDAMAVVEARTDDGRKLGNIPAFNKFLNEMARSGTDPMYMGDGGALKSVDARLKEIEGVMSTDFNKYLRDGLDKEYATLLEKKEARGGR